VARVTNLINKADALKQLNASLKKHKAEYDKEIKEYKVKKAAYDKEMVAYNKAVIAAAVSHLKNLDVDKDMFSRNYRSGAVNVDFSVNTDATRPEYKEEPSSHLIDRIEKQIRSVSIMAGETFNASMLSDDFFNCL
jgi:intein-encoded DNA endonuclease-like protein